jgi:hypothetical protein
MRAYLANGQFSGMSGVEITHGHFKDLLFRIAGIVHAVPVCIFICMYVCMCVCVYVRPHGHVKDHLFRIAGNVHAVCMCTHVFMSCMYVCVCTRIFIITHECCNVQIPVCWSCKKYSFNDMNCNMHTFITHNFTYMKQSKQQMPLTTHLWYLNRHLMDFGSSGVRLTKSLGVQSEPFSSLSFLPALCIRMHAYLNTCVIVDSFLLLAQEKIMYIHVHVCACMCSM